MNFILHLLLNTFTVRSRTHMLMKRIDELGLRRTTKHKRKWWSFIKYHHLFQIIGHVENFVQYLFQTYFSKYIKIGWSAHHNGNDDRIFLSKASLHTIRILFYYDT